MGKQTKWKSAPVDIFENDDEILLRVDLPGVPQDAVTVRLEQGRLQIEGRVFALPASVDADAISAQLDNGVLQVHLRKSERFKPKRIAVH